MLSIVLILKWESMAARCCVLSVQVKMKEPMMEVRYMTSKTKSRAMTRNSGRGKRGSRMEALVSKRGVMMRHEKTIERRGDIADVSDGGVAGEGMVAL